MRNKTSIFSTYALLSVVGFGGFWWFGGTKSGESLNASEAFLAFYSFLSTTVVFYVLASQKQSIDSTYDAITSEVNDRNRDTDAMYRYFDSENEKVVRRIDNEMDLINREIDRINIGRTEDCCKAL